MKFKILKGTELFQKYIDLKTEMERCDKAALMMMREVGAVSVRGDYFAVAGGISSFQFKDNKKPDGWAYAHNDSRTDFVPAKNRKANKELLDKIKALPCVTFEQFNAPLKYNWRIHDNNRISYHPGLWWKKSYILVEISDQYSRYKPVKDMIELTTSEFNKLKGK